MIYRIKNNTFASRGWTWAMHIHPYIDEFAPRCDKCGSTWCIPEFYPQLPITLEVEGGVKYPDSLGCGAWPFFIVSEKVTRDWEREGVTCYRKYPATVVSAKGKKICDESPPHYYHIEVTGRCDLDFDAMDLKIVNICDKCKTMHTISSEKNKLWQPYIVKEDSPDGSDLFVFEYLRYIVFCTDRMFEMAGDFGWTNFAFEDPRDYNIRFDYKIAAKKRASASGKTNKC